MKTLKALVMDIDGTLTDGGIYMSGQGEAMKKFNVKDGYGICHILPNLGIIPVVITGRESEIVENRCKEMKVAELIQKSADKAVDMRRILSRLEIELDETAYMGDDLNDLECMKLVAVSGCPADAVSEVKRNCDFIATKVGGEGAVREFIDWIAERICIEKYMINL